MQMQKISSEQYLRNFVREVDYNLYLLHFFVPRHYRLPILALMGLHCELRTIPKKVQDPMLMLIRLQWWRDEIDKIANGEAYADSPILTVMSSCDLIAGSQKLGKDPLVKSQSDSLFHDYLNRVDESMRGNQADIDEAFYTLMTNAIDNDKARQRFIKKLMHHDELEDKKAFRALRLWSGI